MLSVVASPINNPLSTYLHSHNHINYIDQGRKIVEKLKEVLPRQMFEIVLQAKVQSRVLARATIRPFRKDVLIITLIPNSSFKRCITTSICKNPRNPHRNPAPNKECICMHVCMCLCMYTCV